MCASGEFGGTSVAPAKNFPAGAAAVFSEYSSSGAALPDRCSFSQYWKKGSARYSWPIVAETVDVTVTHAPPVDELDAELERAARRRARIRLRRCAARR